MPTLRSRRLETLFGGPIDETLTFEQVKGLIPNAGESPDLDFKQETYITSGNSGQRGTKDLCGDVAAMANAGGGVIVLGMAEDDQAHAKGYLPVDTSDDERRRLRQTVYDRECVAPGRARRPGPPRGPISPALHPAGSWHLGVRNGQGGSSLDPSGGIGL